MISIHHRRNTIQQLQETPPEYGVEIDIRTFGDKLILHHDAMKEGELFEEWLKHYRHAFLILNVKEEGLEEMILRLMRQHQIEHFFFLDQSFPFLVRTSKAGEKRCAVRVSEFESVDTAIELTHKIEWVWVDCFNRFALTKNEAQKLKQNGFKLCLVSPELQGRHDPEEIQAIRHTFEEWKIPIDAVCTKRLELWT